MRAALHVLGAVLVLTACSDKTLHIESDTSWAGNIEQYGDVSGTGNKNYNLDQTTGRVCWSIGKATQLGTLRVYSADKTWLGLGSEVDDDRSTTEPNGVVTGCSQ